MPKYLYYPTTKENLDEVVSKHGVFKSDEPLVFTESLSQASSEARNKALAAIAQDGRPYTPCVLMVNMALARGIEKPVHEYRYQCKELRPEWYRPACSRYSLKPREGAYQSGQVF